MKYHETQEKHDGLSTFIYVYHGLSTFICVFLFFCQKCWCILLCTPLSDASWNSCNGEGKSDETDGFGAVSFMLRPCDVQINDAHSGAVWDCFCEVPCKTWWTHLEASGFSVFHSHLRTWGWRYAKFSNSRATTTSWCPSITGRSPFFGRILILGSCLAAKFYKSTWKYMKIMKPRKFSMNWVWVRFKAKNQEHQCCSCSIGQHRTAFNFGVPYAAQIIPARYTLTKRSWLSCHGMVVMSSFLRSPLQYSHSF